MTRRQILALAGAAYANTCEMTCADAPEPSQSPSAPPGPADITLRIGEVTIELGPKRSVRTLAYNGQVPGPLLRVNEGQTIAVEVSNDSNEHEIVHWHGLHIPPDVDGSHEEGTPPVPAHGSRRYAFTATPSGTRWYHSHIMAARNLRRATYTGQFGLLVIEPRNGPGRYDLDIPILLHEWEPRIAGDDVEYKLFSINGKMLGAGEPIRVRQSQRALFRLVNASATMSHRLALTGHSLEVIAMDGNAVTNPMKVRSVELGPGERIDAMVEMNNPGVWILGEMDDGQRTGGMGVVVEYADRNGPPRWVPAPDVPWDYTAFGGREAALDPERRMQLEFKQKGEWWTINGKSFPHADPLKVRPDRRYRLVFDNQSAMAHPVHLHRHTFEITRFAGKPSSGVRKDVVVVPAWRQVEVDFVANNPGASLFHCHHQHHMDMGFMALMQYE
jgi:FtsP/CotA-like multicopper oxidase with cupredoxin domain